MSIVITITIRRVLASAALGALALSGPAVTAATASAPAATASAPAASGAGTLVYVNGHDIYLARPDGTGERRLTTDGTAAQPWHTPSGADDGSVVAVRGALVHRMDQWGTVLTTLDPPDLRDSAGQLTGGAVDKAAVSPDGSLIAYSYRRYSCPPGLACKTRWATAVSAADRLTPPEAFGTALYGNPSWVTGSRLVVSGINFDAIQLFDLAAATRHWFHDGNNSSEYLQLSDPAVSRDGTMLATLRGEGDQSHIWTYRVEGNALYGPPPPPPDPACSTHRASGFASPTFAPDGSAVAWQETDGVFVKVSPLECAVQPELAIAGAADPYWTGAALQSVRPTYPDKDGGRTGPKTSGGSFTLATAPTVAGKMRVGKLLKVKGVAWSPAPGRVAYQWLRNGKPIATARKASYRIAGKDRGKRISVRVTASRPGLASTTWTSPTVKVRR